MRMLDHPNVLKALEINLENDLPQIKFENYTSNLKDWMETHDFPNYLQNYFIYQIAEGMRYIYSRKIAKHNMNPSSIFISDDLTIKIGLFSRAEILSRKDQNKILQSSEETDVRYFGRTVYYILSQGELKMDINDDDLKSFPLLARQLIEACLCEDESRPDFTFICEIIEQNNYNLTSLSDQENQKLLSMLSQYKEKMKNKYKIEEWKNKEKEEDYNEQNDNDEEIINEKIRIK